MNIAKRKIIAGLVFTIFQCILFLNFNQPVSAAAKDLFQRGLDSTGGNAGYTVSDPAGSRDLLLKYVSFIIQKGFLSILGIAYLLLMIYAGFTWMKARGNAAEVTRAKDIMINATIGLIVIVAAYAISYFVISALTYETLIVP